MKKNYSAEEILRMAVKSLAAAPEADLDGNGEITAADARLAKRAQAAAKAAPQGAEGQGQAAGAAAGYTEAPQSRFLRAELLDRLVSGADSDLQVNADRLYSQYKDMYAQNASLAAENAYGLASANTGGYGSSYAASAASQAYRRYMEGLTDRAQSIRAQALEEQKAAFDLTAKALNAVNDNEDREYGRYLDDWELAYKAANAGDTGLLEALGLNGEALNAKNDRAFASLAAQYGDMSYLNALGVDTAEYAKSQALQRAVAAAEYGDYSYLKALGVDTDTLEYAKLLDVAAKLAQYGDDSALEALGVDVSRLREEALLEKAVALAAYGDYSLLGSFSENLSGLKQKVSVTVQNGAQDAYAYGGYPALVRYLDRQIGYGQINESTKNQIISVLTGGRYGS